MAEPGGGHGAQVDVHRDLDTVAHFPATLASVADARRFITDVLADSPAGLVDAVALMVSELSTNALLHALSEFEVSVRRDRGVVRVEVRDSGGGGVPELRSPTPKDPHGRGLRIVDRLADAWGTTESPSGGRSIWFTLRSPGAGRTGAAPGAPDRADETSIAERTG